MVVTDSTASLPDEVAAERGIVVVPLQVVIGADAFDEGSPDATPERVAAALREFRPVSTSRPAPAVLLAAYERAAAAGATEIVSVHLSGDMSGTFESAQLAARDAPLPVVCVDSRQVGVATGYAALAAVEAVADGATAIEAAEAARRRADASSSYFYVDTLEYLRRGGRIGAAAALFGGALAVKPLLTIDDGTVSSLEKVRTSARPSRGWPSWPRPRQGSRRSTCASPTSRAPTGPSTSPSSSASAWPSSSRDARSGAPRWARCWEPTSGPA